jgi:glucose-6-phosphate-specific signal transduction histidine kinase
MSRLKLVLEAALPDATSLGGGRNVDRERLIGLLRQLLGDLGRAYWLRAGVALIVLLLLLAIAWRYGDQPGLLAGAVAAMGIVFVGALVALRQVIEEIARVDMMLSLAADLSLETLTMVARRVAAAL